MKPSNLISIVGLFICCLICLICAAVPAVSAETFTEHFYDSEYSHTELTYSTEGYETAENLQTPFIYFRDTGTNYSGTFFITYVGPNIRISRDGVYGDYSNIPIKIGGYSATLSCDETYNLLGQYTKTYIWINFDNFHEIESLQGYNYIVFTSEEHTYSAVSIGKGKGTLIDTDIDTHGSSILHRVYFGGYYYMNYMYWPAETQCVTQYSWNSDLSGIYGEYLSSVSLSRYDVETNFTLLDTAGNTIYTDISDEDINFDFITSEYVYYLTSPSGTIYSRSLVIDEPETEKTVSVLASVKNIQDYSVIGDSTISFVSDTENITRTMPNGYDLFTLAKDTWYNVSASAEGFTPQLEYEQNLWTGSSAIDVWMIPTSEESNETVKMNWYVSESNSAGPGTLRLSNAVISINSKTLITDASGYTSTILNRSGSISYTVKKDGYNTYSRAFTPNWDTYTFPTIDEHITLLKMGESIGDVTPAPTPDTRSSNQKAESAMNILFDNIEGIVQLAVVVLIISLISMIAGGGKKR